MTLVGFGGGISPSKGLTFPISICEPDWDNCSWGWVGFLGRSWGFGWEAASDSADDLGEEKGTTSRLEKSSCCRGAAERARGCLEEEPAESGGEVVWEEAREGWETREAREAWEAVWDDELIVGGVEVEVGVGRLEGWKAEGQATGAGCAGAGCALCPVPGCALCPVPGTRVCYLLAHADAHSCLPACTCMLLPA